ncbi:DNA polymerase III, alpha chain [Ruminococcaceae bacterium YRB3002]|nr:DNA polymerase III, alpha chain [Ruminococcaceae bacterium YRB3002]
MEKKQVRLVDLFANYPDDTLNGIGDLIVDRLDFYDDRIVLSVSGYPDMDDDNSLRRFYAYLRERLDTGVMIKFTDFDREYSYFDEIKRKVRDYVVSRIEGSGCSESGFADAMDYKMENGILFILCPNTLKIMFADERSREVFSRTAAGVWSEILNIRDLEHMFIVEESGDEDLPEERDYYEEAMDILERQAQQTNEKADSRDKETGKDKTKKPVPTGDTWAEKAKSIQKEIKHEQKSFKRNITEGKVFGRVTANVPMRDIDQIEMGAGTVNIAGLLILPEKDKFRLVKNGNSVMSKFNVLDKTGEISCLAFIKPEEADGFEAFLQKNKYMGIQGTVDIIDGEIGIKVSGGFEAEPPKGREDNAPVKRVELHCHTKMSDNDAVTEPADLIKLAARFGHSACAVTDHGVVQAFPHVYNTMKDINKKRSEGEPKFKTILGCEGYLADDGPTIVYGLPLPKDDFRHIGSFVTLSIRTTGDDPNEDVMTEIWASKYRAKGYIGKKIPFEGETDEDAMEFSRKDIDTSLWQPEEIPEQLRDEHISIPPVEPHAKIAEIINEDAVVFTECEDEETVPANIEFEHVADFHACFEDVIYSGKGEPCESYFLMGELLEFMDQSYIAGRDIFRKLGFLRRAGFGINIEEHVYYRNKFLMPAISVEDIIRYGGSEYDVSCDSDALEDQCRADAEAVISYLENQNSIDPVLLNKLIGHMSDEDVKANSRDKKAPLYHIIFLTRNYTGLYDLYRIVSESNIDFFSVRPRTPKSRLKYYSSGLIIGGACERGEIYRYVVDVYKECGKDHDKCIEILRSSERMRDILDLYDYIEVQPLCNNMFMTRIKPKPEDVGFVPLNGDDIRIINEMLVELADIYGMPCCATTDSHFLEKEDGMYRKYMLMNMGFEDAEMQSDLYFRTTDEMLQEFSYLGEDKAYEVVVTNTNMIADRIEFGLKPFPDGTYPPIIARAAADIRDIVYTRANTLYRHNGVLNETVAARIEKELSSIFEHGFAIMYYIAYRLVKKSNNDGYIVGSRGSVGSSFVATMSGISEVNPLPPHYRCPNCNYVEFDNTGVFGSGFDMPVKACPECGTVMGKDGQDIPFETFLGFFGDKQPDIDLNFSGEYQPNAHKYVEFLFGTTHTFKAGTISAYKDKNAYGVAKSACEKLGISATRAKLDYMSRGIIGVKRTTSQHPGGMVVVPKEMDVYEFTPIQCPANKINDDIVTTHFDFRAMHDTILKLDILGHADPTVLRMLHDITKATLDRDDILGDKSPDIMDKLRDIAENGVTTIPIPDEKVMSLLSTTDALGFPPEATEAGAGTLGLSELGTPMARGMIAETKPARFYDLVQLMGLSHGTDVWTGNAQDLIRSGTCDLNSVIGCRDSIMTTLIYWGLPNKDSFDIMEKVRKGKGLTPEHEQLMRDNNVPDWYIGSCKKIKYMFPKAHAAAYSISSLRVAWYKVYYPEAYYCAYFSIRGDEFDAYTMCNGIERVIEHRHAIEERRRTNAEDRDNPKVKSEILLCESVEEMYARGITFAPITLEESLGSRFSIKKKGVIIPPFNSIRDISSSMGEAIETARVDGPFKNREEFARRTGLGNSTVDKLAEYGGILDGLPESAQVDMFSLFDSYGGE